jgi:primary-amine oxidase
MEPGDGPLSDGIAAKDEHGNQLEFGQLVAPGVDGVDHDHFFSYRLDLDVDGAENSFMADKLVQYKLPASNPSPLRVIWAMQPTMINKEGDAMMDIEIKHPSMWRFVNHNIKDPYGYPTSFEIMAGETAASLLPDTECRRNVLDFLHTSYGSLRMTAMSFMQAAHTPSTAKETMVFRHG